METSITLQPTPEILPLQSRPSALDPQLRRQSLSPNPAIIAARRQLQSLNGKIRQQVTANRRRYQKLLSLNPYFSMKLLAPVNTLTDEGHASLLGKMMRQVDLLLEEGNLLQKEIKKAELRRMQVDHQDPSLRDELKHHFAFLRRIWVDAGREEGRGLMDRMEELNKRVVIIKNGIIAAADHQKKRHEILRADQYETVDRRARETVRESDEYRRLRESWERLGMRLQQKEARLREVVESYQQKLREKDEQILRWRRESEQLKRLTTQLKEKILSSQMKQAKLLQKICQLQSQLKNKSKGMTLKENNETGDNLTFLKESFINQIKFRKMDFDPIAQARRNHFDQKESHSEKIVPETSDIPQNQEATSHSTPQIKQTPLPSPHQILQKQPSNTTTNQQQDGRQSKSIDTKKGRFTRMRSPANGKLIKPRPQDQKRRQLQCVSPKLKELRQEYGDKVAGLKAYQLE